MAQSADLFASLPKLRRPARLQPGVTRLTWTEIADALGDDAREALRVAEVKMRTGSKVLAPFAVGAAERAVASRGFARLCGVDEAGRGPLAGPVSAGAVFFAPGSALHPDLAGLHDSKRLTPEVRARLVPAIQQHALAWGIAMVDNVRIDRINILRAAQEAMALALADAWRQLVEKSLAIGPVGILVDGDAPLPAERLAFLASVQPRQLTLVQGDGLSHAIAAASVLAKEARDAEMRRYDSVFPGYGFRDHVGYPTASHAAALERLGPCAIHRRTFAGVAMRSVQRLACAPITCADSRAPRPLGITT